MGLVGICVQFFEMGQNVPYLTTSVCPGDANVSLPLGLLSFSCMCTPSGHFSLPFSLGLPISHYQSPRSEGFISLKTSVLYH